MWSRPSVAGQCPLQRLSAWAQDYRVIIMGVTVVEVTAANESPLALRPERDDRAQRLPLRRAQVLRPQ